MMFKTLLIANRGEIACRIIKTAKAMGLKTIAVYSEADSKSLHTQLADVAIYIGEAKSQDSYLNIDNIIQAAIITNADAIHPGYGFLSENADFAKACAKNNITFIGPSVDALLIMGSKQSAKLCLENSAVPMTPGYHGKDQSDAALLKEAKRIDFPVLLKAANGGGGKGMKTVVDEKAFSEALASAKREAMASFADDTMIIEKLIQEPRHVEVQIMADTLGNVVHLFERDCSIQRRHQKVIEEAPAPNLSDDLREKLHRAACTVAQKINYHGAGTVEFLVDKYEQLYFMEMNTRLQVEHPVTEMITGVDLVAWQIKIAAGEPLPKQQAEIKIHGHAIECRIYAEDPNNNFLPSIGPIRFLSEPLMTNIRIDTGIIEGSQITQYYDPMIAKLIAYGETREEACNQLVNALSHYAIYGVKTNIEFLKSIISHPYFREAKLNTHFLSDVILEKPELNVYDALILSACHDFEVLFQHEADPLLQATLGFHSFTQRSIDFVYQYLDETFTVHLTPTGYPNAEVKIGSETLDVMLQRKGDKLSVITPHKHINGIVFSTKADIALFLEQGLVTLSRFNQQRQSQHHEKENALTAPMPSTVVAVLKQKGDKVKLGECLIVLEAMKMEHAIHAPKDGKITDIFYHVGAQVKEGEALLSLE